MFIEFKGRIKFILEFKLKICLKNRGHVGTK